jgi:phenazine biosynthesis protein phzE
MATYADIGRLMDPAAGAFALIYRPQSGGGDRIDVLVGPVSTVERLSDLRLPARDAQPAPRHDLLAIIPYRQIRERGFACRDDGTPLIALTVEHQGWMSPAAAIRSLPDAHVALSGAGFDVGDLAYADIVRKILSDEIGQGAGSNFVIKRSFIADIANFSRATALTIFRRLLSVEAGSYWTFVVHTGARTLVGATPERHVSLVGGKAAMNPISGTYRYPPGGPGLADVLRFLADQKETDELYMVVDEELKMMARVCERGGRVVGPFLKEMARLAHTEYVIEGRSALDVREILHETMFAPPVVGSPLENACRVITRYEASGRGYYGGVLALIGRDVAGAATLDSAILIRTADIAATGRMKIDVGATLVRHSDPASEVAETTAKAAGLLAALRHNPPAGAAAQAGDGAGQFAVRRALGADPAVRAALEQRNATLAGFWLDAGYSASCAVPAMTGAEVLLIDAEDTFIAMLAHQLRSLGLSVTAKKYDAVSDGDGGDLVVVGPGPGDPLNTRDPKIARLRDITADLLRRRTPLLGLCLGHQILARLLGFTVARKDIPNQGLQREISLFGQVHRVGFYNTYAAFSVRGDPGLAGRGRDGLTISRDERTGEIHALRGRGFSSFQFHPESVLTQHGVPILAQEVTALLARAPNACGAR